MYEDELAVWFKLDDCDSVIHYKEVLSMDMSCTEDLSCKYLQIDL
jgi:hypothetical protein